MPHQLPKQQFHRDQFITLNEGFDRAGRFMFAQDWTGHEAFALPFDDPQVLRDMKARLEAEIQRASQHARQMRTTNTFGIEPDEAAEHYAHQKQAEADRDDVRERLDRFRQPYDACIADAEAYERRAAVEHRLCGAIKSGELDVRLGHGFGVEIEHWFQRDRFQISFAFSYIVAPERHGRRRRFPAYLIKDRFNLWARPQEADLMRYRTDSIEEQMIEWFLVFRANCLVQSLKVNKANAKAECDAYFGRSELGAMFDAVWKLLAPREWTKGGRPSRNR